MRGVVVDGDVTGPDQGFQDPPPVAAALPAGRGFHVKKLSPEDREEIVRAYLKGAAVKNLARQYGVDRAAIRHHLILRGIALRGREHR